MVSRVPGEVDQLGLWPAHHPQRGCYTCGAAPSGTFHDGSPKYSCSHPPVREIDPAKLDLTYYGAVPWTLTADEMGKSRGHARDSIAHAKERGYHHKFIPADGESEEDFATRGYAAELAAGHVTGLTVHWHLLKLRYRRQDKRPDLGVKVEVRNAKRDFGLLVARPGDPIDWYYLLVTGPGPKFMVWGWLPGVDLMVPLNWRADWDPPAWTARHLAVLPLPLPPDA